MINQQQQYIPPQGAAPEYMQQPIQQQAQPAIQPGITFKLDNKVQEILNSVHPELVNAMVGIAIKKFAQTPEFIDFYVREEFKQVVEQQAQQAQSSQATTQTTAPKASAVSFDSW